MKRTKLSPDMTYAEWAAYWLKNTADCREETTGAKYAEALESTILPALGEKRLNEITEEIITAFLAAEQEKGKSVARLATLRSVLTVSLKSAVSHRLIPRNPCASVKLARRPRGENAILKEEDLRRLIREYGDHRYLPAILMMLFLGLRIGEAIGLDWDKADPEAGTVTVCQQVVGYYAQQRTQQRLVDHTKNRTERTLPLCDPAREILQNLKEKAEREYGKAEGPVFREADGSRLVYHKVYYEFRKIMAAIGRPDIHPHSLRHTAASALLYTTGDLLLVKEFLGHRSVRSSERYPEATEREMEEAAKVLDDYFRPYWLQVFPENGNREEPA